MQWTIEDLEFLKLTGIQIDAEDFEAVHRYENTHRNLSPCSDCGVATFGQHEATCRWATLLWLPRWYERFSDWTLPARFRKMAERS
jgi:hypothetical protein